MEYGKEVEFLVVYINEAHALDETKTLGTNTPRNVVNAVMAGLRSLRDPEERLAQLGRSR